MSTEDDPMPLVRIVFETTDAGTDPLQIRFFISQWVADAVEAAPFHIESGYIEVLAGTERFWA